MKIRLLIVPLVTLFALIGCGVLSFNLFSVLQENQQLKDEVANINKASTIRVFNTKTDLINYVTDCQKRIKDCNNFSLRDTANTDGFCMWIGTLGKETGTNCGLKYDEAYSYLVALTIVDEDLYLIHTNSNIIAPIDKWQGILNRVVAK